MVPKKAKDFKPETAKDLNLPEDMVSKLIDFYWEKIRKDIITLDFYNINIINLGTFKVKHWKIDETIEGYNKLIAAMEGKFSAYAIKKEYEARIEKLNRIKDLVLEQNLKFKDIKENRYDKKNKNNLEEQGPDMGRLQEPDIQE